MASIYAHCYLAIIAAEGSDDEHGICGIGATSGPREGNSNFQFDDIQCGRTKNSEQKNVWHTLGWTFQERILARRYLVFRDRRVHWECETSRIEENFGMTDRDAQVYDGTPYALDMKD